MFLLRVVNNLHVGWARRCFGPSKTPGVVILAQGIWAAVLLVWKRAEEAVAPTVENRRLHSQHGKGWRYFNISNDVSCVKGLGLLAFVVSGTRFT